MKEGTNDNDTWQPISLAAGRVLQKMNGSQESPESKPDPTKDEGEIRKPEQSDAYVDAGLKRIREFERRYRSNRTGR